MNKLLLLSIVLLSGCQMTPEERQAFYDNIKFVDIENNATIQIGVSQLESMLKDPDSVKYKNALTYTDTRGKVNYCIQYNAKNSYGGYSGYSWAFIDHTGLVNGSVSSSAYDSICSSKLEYAIKNSLRHTQ